MSDDLNGSHIAVQPLVHHEKYQLLEINFILTLKSIPPTKILDGIIVPNFGAAVVCVVIG